jgi:hypothetical protein
MYPGLAGNKYNSQEEIKLVNIMTSQLVIKVKTKYVYIENTSANSGPFCLGLSQNSENLLPNFQLSGTNNMNHIKYS